MPEIYGKLYSHTFERSMMGAGPVVFATWAWVLSHAGYRDRVNLNPKTLAQQIGCTTEEIERSLEYLCGPDDYSSSPVLDGARLERTGPYEYRVINLGKYNSGSDDIKYREQATERQRRKRRRDAGLCESDGCERPPVSGAHVCSEHAFTVENQ